MNKIKKFLIVLIGLGVVLGTGISGATLTGGPAPMVTRPATPVPSDDLIISGGCIRFTENGPRWHINDNHETIGLIDTSTEPFINDDGFLEFNLTETGVNQVVSMTMSPDETMAARGLMAGASGGVSSVRVRLSKPSMTAGEWSPLNLNLPVHYSRVEGENSNLWITLVHRVD